MSTAASRPRCLDITAHMDHRFGGLTTSLPAYGQALRETGRYESELAAFCLPGEAPPESGVEPVVFPLGRLRWMVDQRLRRRLRELIAHAAAVHIHGIWSEHCSIAGEFSRAGKKPYLISAHGMIEPWAMRDKAWKKKLYWSAIEKANLNRASCLRALTAAEAGQYRALGLRPPVAVIPNGVTAPASIDPESFFRTYPDLRGKMIVLFLGRLHRKKGIRLLIEVWSGICGQHPNAHIVIAGPDSGGQQLMLENLAAERGIVSRVTFAGMLRGDQKWAALRAASFFTLPSSSEGFSISVLESLAAGTPVILSRQCYFPEVEEYQCGWTIDPEPDALRAAMEECLTLSPAERSAMSKRAQRLAQERFSWPVIGARTAAVLDWLLGGGSPPDCVEMLP